MATTNLGRVAIVPRGTWSAATTYKKLDLVTFEGSSYIALQNNSNKPVSNTTYWQKIAQKGDQGIQGIQGIQGETGNGIASIELTNTSGAVKTYTITYTNGNTTTFQVTDGEVTNAVLAEELEAYALRDGYYEEMTVGAAENLTGRGTGVPAMFTRRTTGGDADVADGVALLNKIKGKTIVWNQLIARSSATYSSYTLTCSADNVYTLTYDTTGNEATTYCVIGFVGNSNTNDRYGRLGHTYYVRGSIIEQTGEHPINFWYLNTAWKNVFPRGTTVEEHGNTYTGLYIPLYAGRTGTMKFTVSVFDLTRMFGAGNEPTMDEFDMLFPNNCLPPKLYELININDCILKTIGFNQWDEDWERGTYSSETGEKSSFGGAIRNVNYIPIFPNTAYNITKPNGKYTRVFYYDINKNFISAPDVIWTNQPTTVFTTPENAYYMNFFVYYPDGTYRNDICINLSWSGYRNGEYEPYWDYTKELPINTYFSEGMKSTPVSYDELTKDRAISRIGTMVFDGSDDENWQENPNAAEGYKIYYISNVTNLYSDLEEQENTVFGNRILLNTYKYAQWSSTMPPFTVALHNKSDVSWIVFSGGNIAELDSVSKLKTLLHSNPLIINYVKKEAVTTEIETPLNLSYKVSDFGTEEAIFDQETNNKLAIFGADIVYGMNAADTLRRLPENYISKDSMEAFLSTLNTVTNGTWSMTYNSETNKYVFSYVANEEPEGGE